MPATKTGQAIVASQSLAAGGTVTSTSVDLTTAYGMEILANILNGATAPTEPAQFQVEASRDDTNWFNVASFLGPTGNSESLDFSYRVPPETRFARVVFTGNTGQAVTVEAQGNILTDV